MLNDSGSGNSTARFFCQQKIRVVLSFANSAAGHWIGTVRMSTDEYGFQRTGGLVCKVPFANKKSVLF